MTTTATRSRPPVHRKYSDDQVTLAKHLIRSAPKQTVTILAPGTLAMIERETGIKRRTLKAISMGHLHPDT